MFTVIATLDAKSGKEEELQQTLLSLVPLTRQEEGCIDYHLHRCLGQAGRFVFYENWASKAEWEKHLEMPYIQDLLATAGDLLANELQLEDLQFAMLSDWARRD